MSNSINDSTTSTPAGPSRNTSFANLPIAHRFETSPLLGTTPERKVPSLAALGKQMLGERKGDAGNENGSGNGTGNGMPKFNPEGVGSSREGSERDVLILPGEGNNTGYLSPYGDTGPRRRIVRKHSVAETIKTRSRYYIPVMEWLPKYEWRSFPNDFIAGCTLACLLIPQAMSYASGLAHLPPVAGLYSSALPGLIYSLLGTCKQLSVGPEAALSLLVGQMIQEIVNRDPHDLPGVEEQGRIAIAVGVVMTMQVGMITFALGICRLGYLDILLNRALLRGFLTAIATIILIEQLIPMLGLARLVGTAAHASPFQKFLFLVTHIRQANPYTAIISITSLSWLIGARSTKIALRKKYPSINFVSEILVLVVVAIVVTGVCRLDLKGVDVLGKLEAGSGMPFGFPLSTKYLKYFHYTFPTSAVIAIVGYVDSVVAAKENSAKYGYAISPNRELVALGASNLAASFLTLTGSLPVFGAITRSRLNGNVGGRSQMSSIVTCFCIILTSLFLLPYFYYLPKAVLGSIISIVVYSILAELPHDLSFFWRVSAWTDMMQMALTCFLTLFFNVELGLVASVCFSLILVIQKSTRTRIKIMGRLPGSDSWIPVDEDPEAIEEDLPGVLVVRIRENLNFANSASLRERLRRLELYGMEKSHPSEAPKRDSARAIVFHMNDVEEIDASALQIIMDFVQAYTERDVAIHFVHLRRDQMKAFEVVGLAERLGSNHFHADLRSAMAVIEEHTSGLMGSAFSGV